MIALILVLAGACMIESPIGLGCILAAVLYVLAR